MIKVHKVPWDGFYLAKCVNAPQIISYYVTQELVGAMNQTKLVH